MRLKIAASLSKEDGEIEARKREEKRGKE